MSLKKNTIVLLTSLISLSRAQDNFSGVNYAQYVNPLIGSEGPMPGQAFGGGDIFVGGAVPFGVVKFGIDTYETNLTLSTINGGYTPEGLVTGVSLMHESGTGGAPKYGIVHQMPLTTITSPVNILDNTTYWQRRVGNETAQIGYYSSTLENGIAIRLSAARHSGIVQYDYPPGEGHVLVDVSHYLPGYDGYNSQDFLGGEIELRDGGQQYTGYGQYGGGFGEGAPMRVYFCGEFENAPDQAQTWRARNTDPYLRQHVFSNEPYGMPTYTGNVSQQSGFLNDRVGAVFSWTGTNSSSSSVVSKIGISFISVDKACTFKDDEISSWEVNDTASAAVDEWNTDVFSKIQVPLDASQNETNIILLYSSLYFMHLMPSDRTGENPLWESDEPSFDDFYTAWDIFRCTVSLYHLLQPDYYEGMIRSLIDIWRHEGYMPDGRSGNYNGLTQGGSNADNILADAYVKGLRRGINWTAGYQAMVKDAEVVPYNTFSPLDMTGSVKEGRGALFDWIPLGYLSVDGSARSLSRSVEYSLNDFSLYQVALGEAPQDAQKYLNRSAQWQNNWSHDAVSVNTTPEVFTGFLAPRLQNGQFNLSGYNPALCGGCEWDAITYEATPFEYSFVVPHDVETLVAFMGGAPSFEARLDYIFRPNTSQQNLGANGAGITTIMNIGNEPDFATPYLYHYVNKQHKSAQQSRSLANEFFHNSDYGVPGNSDAGALNSWLLWQMLGLYPIVTQPVYLLGSPWFGDVNVTINNNSTLRIVAHGLDDASASYYVQSVVVNGRNWTQNWLQHTDVMVQGGTVEFFLGTNPVVWETGPPPPSPGHGGVPNPNGTYAMAETIGYKRLKRRDLGI
ncbi:uncharacterized protein PV06_04677 [Exophiala oligosperma]|uniref:Glycosyl hydrolase family 92 domain-containing protein n=1 Tax=Exophiala oligosperma TaxID=215243 RepID=A0A0D2DMD0_9EURO|nr:uncharacterized protein PV06_04677 [Exophiala oligosperma]KIW43590.1 hypothetical protein PV06_04677 [Exophiala oligosperma]